MRKTGGGPPELGRWRKAIDKLDDRIVKLLGERAKCAIEIGKIKSKTGGPVLDPKHEAEVISRVKKLNKKFPPKSLEAIYGEIFTASRAIEKPASVARTVKRPVAAAPALKNPARAAYLGPAGTFSNEAAAEIFGPDSELRPCPDFPSVFREVEEGRADYGVLPVENSVGGSVDAAMDLLNQSRLRIVGEKTIQVRQVLASKAKSIGEIRTLISHQQPLSQCRRFIASELPGVGIIERQSTTSAAAEAAERPHSAAICSLVAARSYGLNVLKEGVEDFPSFTRFVVLSDGEAEPTGRDKTSIAVTIKNKPGELYRLLGVFYKRGINLTRIVSRPIPASNWGYLFFIDFDGHKKDAKPSAALKTVMKTGESLNILGSYPREG
ncbi:MAG: prephenate dehydratase [Nitrospinae bacterium]|nr:prephenate dehydratase [Nitrospinota bacterium]